MPRSSRHKHHKQSKHSSKDVREWSDSEEDVNLKSRNGEDDNMVRVSRDMASGEKRRHSQDGNADFSDDYVASKRRKEGADLTDNSDRWKGVEEDRRKKEKMDCSRTHSETFIKIKVLVDSSSHKSSRRNENLKKENNAVIESEEAQKTGSSKNEIKYKSEKDSRRKEIYEYKDGKEKGPDRERKFRDPKKEILIDAVPGRGSEDGESGRKRVSQSLHVEEVRSRKQEVETDEWQVQDDVCNPDLEKEYEKRIRRRRDASVDKDKYQDDTSEGSNRYFSSKDDHTKIGPYKDERSGRDKSKDDRYRDKYREDVNRDHRRDDRHLDDLSLRDHGDRSDTRHFRDDSTTEENLYKMSRPHDSDPDGSSHLVEVGTKYKAVKEKKRIAKENEGHNGIKSRNSVEHRADVEKKPSSSSRLSSVAERGRSQSSHLDVDFNVSTNKWSTSPSSNVHAGKDQYRYNTKQAESKYRDSISEEGVRTNIASSRDLTCPSRASARTSERISLEKPIQKDEKYVHEMSNLRPRRPDAQPSPKLIIEKSPSSSSYDRRYPNRSTFRRSLDVEELGGRSIGVKDVRDHSANEERRSRDLPSEKPVVDQPDGDTLSLTSSVNRSGHFLGNPSSSLLPPPLPSLRTVVSSPPVMEEDSRGKPNNRYRRYGDPNAGRGLGNTWKGLPSWPSLVTNGSIPYSHGPPPGVFHPLMQQFPAHFFGVRPTMDLHHARLPYIPDADRFSSHGRSYVWQNADGPFSPHMQGWDGSNRVFGDEAQMYGMPDWDQNRHPLSGRGWETNVELEKGKKNSVNMELPPAASQKEDHPQLMSSSEARSGPFDQQLQNERNHPGSFREETIEVKEFNARAKSLSPEAPRKIHNVADEGAPQFCGVYLCKLDTSIDLCHPELYNSCIRLLEDKSASAIKDVKEHDYMEERVQSGVRISNAIKSASFFPKIDESIFQRALGLYRKQADEMKVIHRSTPTLKDVENLTYEMEKLAQFPITEEEEDPTAEGENHKHIPTTEEEEVMLVSSMEEKVPEPVSATEQVEVEPVPCMKQEKLGTVPTIENGELQPVPTTDHDKLEPISATVEENLNVVTITEEEKPQPRVSCTIDEEMAELSSSFDFEKLEPGVASDQDMIELHPTPQLDKCEEHLLILNQEEHQVLAPEQEKLEAIPVAGSESVDEMSPTSFQDIMEEEPPTHEQNMKEEPCTVLVKKEQEEPDTTSTRETAGPILENTKEEVVVSDHSSIHGQSSLATTEYPFIEEEITRARNCKGSHDPKEQKAFTDANCGSPSIGFIAGSSEGCEALMPESIECRLVSLRRIYNFPENTH